MLNNVISKKKKKEKPINKTFKIKMCLGSKRKIAQNYIWPYIGDQPYGLKFEKNNNNLKIQSYI